MYLHGNFLYSEGGYSCDLTNGPVNYGPGSLLVGPNGWLGCGPILGPPFADEGFKMAKLARTCVG